MKTHFFGLVLLAFVTASCNLEPSIDHLRVCNDPDYDMTCPSDKTVLKASETDKLYVSATISHVPKNTEMSITWYYLGNEESVIDEITLRTDEDMVDMPVYSYLPQPSGGWLTGTYKVKIDVKMENAPEAVKEFSIE